MPYCPRCGVETDPSVRNCPLCATSIPIFDDLGPGEPAWPGTQDRNADLSKTYATPVQIRNRTLGALASVEAVAALVVVTVNFFSDGHLSWCLYPLSALLALFGAVLAVFTWKKTPWKWGLAWAGLTAGLLGAIDGISSGTLTWFTCLGLPLTVWTFGLLFLGVWALGKIRRRGYNLLAWVSVLALAELIAIDFLVTIASTGRPGLGWSMVTTLVLGAFTILVILLHLTLRRPPDWGRTFHL